MAWYQRNNFDEKQSKYPQCNTYNTLQLIILLVDFQAKQEV